MSIIEKSLERQRRDARVPPTSPAPSANSVRNGAPHAPIAAATTRDLRAKIELSTTSAAPPRVKAMRQSQLRTIRRRMANLAHASATLGSRARMFAITSALPGEGKTYTASNLAVSLARDASTQVLLVDADLPKRDLTKRFGCEDLPGLSEAIVGDSRDPLKVAVDTCIPQLTFMPAGHAYAAACEALTADTFATILDPLVVAHPNLLILVDAGPILLSSEAEATVRQCGHAIFVVRSGSTSPAVLQDALARLPSDMQAHAILNAWEKSPFSTGPANYYESYYGDSPGS